MKSGTKYPTTNKIDISKIGSRIILEEGVPCSYFNSTTMLPKGSVIELLSVRTMTKGIGLEESFPAATHFGSIQLKYFGPAAEAEKKRHLAKDPLHYVITVVLDKEGKIIKHI